MEKILRRVLPNGLRVIYLKKPIFSVSMVVAVRAGFLEEKKELLGISHLLEHMLFDGSKKWGSEFLFNDAAEQLGGDINGVTDEFSTSYEIHVAEQDYKQAAELLSDMIQNPLLKEKEFLKEKKVIKAELMQRRDYLKKNPVKTKFFSYMDGFDSKKYIDEELKCLKSLNRMQLMDYFQKNYSPKNMVLGIVGGMEDPFSVVEKYFSKEEKKIVQAKKMPKFNLPRKRIERVKDNDEVSSAYFCWFGPGAFSEEKAVFEVCAKILAKGEKGIIKEIRFDQGLAYEVDAGIQSDERKGVFVVSVKTTRENLGRVERIVREKITLLKEVSEESVTRAKRSILAESVLDMEEYVDVARILATYELFGQKTPYEGYFEKVERINASEVKEFANKYLGENFVLITSKK
jgi:predicted Zn-dependent peptidase